MRRLAPHIRLLEPNHLPIKYSVTGLSDIGRTRKRNEDSLSLIPELGVAVVADGMGGHPGGDVASQIAAATAARLIGEAVEAGGKEEASPLDFLRTTMTDAVMAAHGEIRARGAEEPELEGMGTTITAMVVDPSSGSFVIGQVGDSRAYRFRDGALTQLTRDDTWVQERVEKGDISAEAARKHPFGHLLTQCLGLDDPPKPQILDDVVAEGDVFLLCTDGLVGMLEDPEMVQILEQHMSANGSLDSEEASASIQALLDAANEAGGHDNITAAIVRIGSD